MIISITTKTQRTQLGVLCVVSFLVVGCNEPIQRKGISEEKYFQKVEKEIVPVSSWKRIEHLSASNHSSTFIRRSDQLISKLARCGIRLNAKNMLEGTISISKKDCVATLLGSSPVKIKDASYMPSLEELTGIETQTAQILYSLMHGSSHITIDYDVSLDDVSLDEIFLDARNSWSPKSIRIDSKQGVSVRFEMLNRRKQPSAQLLLNLETMSQSGLERNLLNGAIPQLTYSIPCIGKKRCLIRVIWVYLPEREDWCLADAVICGEILPPPVPRIQPSMNLEQKMAAAKQASREHAENQNPTESMAFRFGDRIVDEGWIILGRGLSTKVD